MCMSCKMGMCAYCTLDNCSCNDNPTDEISRQIHENRPKERNNEN